MLYCLDTLPNLIFIPVPPTNIFQFLNCLIIKAFAYRFCWNTTNNGIWLNIFCYNSPASYDCTVSNCNPGKNNCFIANPNIISYLKNGSSVFHTISILSSPLIITFLITFWIFSLSKDSILMILSNCVSNLLEELSSGGISVLSCSIS